MSMQIRLSRQIDETLAADIEKEAAFVSPHLDRLMVSPDLSAVEVACIDPSFENEVQGKVERFLAAMLQRTHQFDTAVFLETERSDSGPFTENTHAELVSRGWLHDYGRGHVALSGPPLRLLNYIDGYAAAAYEKAFSAVPRDFPALVDAELLGKCGYFDSHPNAVCFVGHVVEDFDAIEEFRLNNSKGDSVVLPPANHIHHPGLCLNPAACFPCYPTLSGQKIGEDGVVLSWKGRVFRFESKNVAGLDRLWEFNVRELVFAGSEEFVRAGRQAALPVVAEIASHLDLECRIETAADPFFATVSAAKTFWQRAQEVKNEIVLPFAADETGGARTMACGSINLHGNFFGERFDFEAPDGQTGSTACVGLGLERWVLAAFGQHGFDEKRWPKAVRRQIFD